MTKTYRSILPIAAIVILSGAIAFSASAHPTDRLVEQLELTDAQQQSLASIRAEFAPARESVQTQREKVVALVKSGNVDGAADLAANQARDRVYQRAEMHRRISEILTPEQQAKMEQLRSSRADRQQKGRRHARSNFFALDEDSI